MLPGSCACWPAGGRGLASEPFPTLPLEPTMLLAGPGNAPLLQPLLPPLVLYNLVWQNGAWWLFLAGGHDQSIRRALCSRPALPYRSCTAPHRTLFSLSCTWDPPCCPPIVCPLLLCRACLLPQLRAASRPAQGEVRSQHAVVKTLGGARSVLQMGRCFHTDCKAAAPCNILCIQQGL